MSTGFKVSTKEFSKSLNKVMDMLKVGGPKVIKEQAVLVLVRAQKGFTPPKNKKAGVTKIRSDISSSDSSQPARASGPFFVIQPWMTPTTQLDGKYGNRNYVTLYGTRKGNALGVKQPEYRPNASVSEMRARHKSRYKVGARIGVSRMRTMRVSGNFWDLQQMAVEERAMKRYMAFMGKRVGALKGGWNSALNGLGASHQIPAWVKKAQSSAVKGIFKNRLKVPFFPSVTIGNQSPSIGRFRVDWQTILDTRARDMVRRAKYLVRKAKKAGRM
jgi:hypothetical protein